MTCDEVRKIMEGSIGKGGPAAVTRAERWAVLEHYQGCKSCQDYVEAQAALERRLMTAEDLAMSRESADILLACDLADPEAN